MFWLEDKLEDIPFSSLSSSLYCVHSQSVAPILEDMADFFVYRVLMHVTASLPSGYFSAFIITPPLALAIATMSTANVFGLFLLAPITDVLSHRCLGATPGSVGAF